MSKVLIIGPGAVGAAIAAALFQLGHTPGFIGRKGPQAYRVELLPGQQQGFSQEPLVYEFLAPDSEFFSEVSACFITVKAFDLENALKKTLLIPDSSPIIALGNGSFEGLLKSFADTYASARTFRLGLATIGVSLLAREGLVRYGLRSQRGYFSFGHFVGPKKEPTDFEKSLTEHGTLFRWETDAINAHRRKWLFNTALNSICAVYQLSKNGDVLKFHGALLKRIFQEAYHLGAVRWGAWGCGEETLYQELVDLIASTADNENSMARDCRLKLRTESQFLAGLAAGDQRFPELNRIHKVLEPLS